MKVKLGGGQFAPTSGYPDGYGRAWTRIFTFEVFQVQTMTHLGS